MVGDVDTCLPSMCAELGIRLSKEEQKMNVRPLIALICRRFFGDFTGERVYGIERVREESLSAFVDLVVQHIPSPQENARRKIEHTWLGPAESKMAKELYKCDAEVSRRERIE